MTPITRDSIAARILDGEHLFILNGELIRVSQNWLSAHPGGALAILHFVGRDATDEIEAYHPKRVLENMRAFSQGPVQLSEDGWVPLLPPICTGWIRKISAGGVPHWHNEAIPDHSEDAPSSQILLVKKSDAPLTSGPSLASIQPPPTTLSLKTQTQHSAAYKELHRRVVAAGLYRTRYISGYGPEVARYVLLSLSSYLLYQRHMYSLSAVFLGALWHQLVFTCHDLGHVGVTHSWLKDRLTAIFLADFIGGVSIGWWVHVCPFWRISNWLSTHLLDSLESQRPSWYGFHVAQLPLAQRWFFTVVTNHPSQYAMLLLYPFSFHHRFSVTQIFNTYPSSP